MQTHKNAADSIFEVFEIVEDFDPSEYSEKPQKDCKGLTFWVPIELKKKYDRIQDKSENAFGKIIRSAVIKAIDKVRVDD